MKGTELIKLLKKAKCYKVREGANHEIWYSPITGNTFAVPRHYSPDVKTGSANNILKDAGIK